MRFSPLALSLSVSLLAPGVFAQTDPSEALITHGVALRSAGHDDEALAEFTRAYELSHSPRAVAQMGFAEQALGRWLLADGHVRQALAASGDPWVTRTRAVLEGALAEISRHLGRLEVRANIAGAEVFIENTRVATLPMTEPARVLAGSNVIEVRAVGYHTVSRAVNVPETGLAREVVELVAEASGPGVVPARSGGSTLRTLAWVSAGASALAFGGALVAWRLREGEAGTYNDDPRCVGEVSAETLATCAALRESSVQGAQSAETWTAVGLIAGGALAVTAGVLFAVSPRASRAQAFGCGPGPGTVGVMCGARF